MVNYVEQARRLAEENQRRMSMVMDELQAIQEQTAKSGREFEERLAAEMSRFWEEQAEEAEKTQAEAEERERLETEQREQREALEIEAREQRQAIARSMAARKANDVVAPIDDEDEEAAFYQRKSWLI